MDTRIKFLYLSEPDMIKAGVKNMDQCVEAMEDLLVTLNKGDYVMAGVNHNSHGAQVIFPDDPQFEGMPKNADDRRFMAMPAYLGGKYQMAGMKWYGSNCENKASGLPRSILMMMLNDKDTGAPLALMSANLVSCYRTGAIPGVGAKYLAGKDSETVTIIGPGVYDNGKTFDLTVKTSDESRATMEDIRNLMIDAGGKKAPLSYVAEIRSVTGPNTINRENVQRKIVISGNVSERDLRSIVNEIQQKIDASIQLPEGYHIEYGGQFESEQAASRTLLLTSLMSLLVIFLLLYNEFKNAKESGVILLNLPLALIGGVFILKLTSGEVSIPAIIGFISLFGIATRNGMLLISHYTHLRTVENVPLKQAVLQGSMDRLNPILMTALSSALALIPLALNGDLPGNEIQSPMATVILGGLLTSTFLNGFIIPIVTWSKYLSLPQR